MRVAVWAAVSMGLAACGARTEAERIAQARAECAEHRARLLRAVYEISRGPRALGPLARAHLFPNLQGFVDGRTNPWAWDLLRASWARRDPWGNRYWCDPEPWSPFAVRGWLFPFLLEVGSSGPDGRRGTADDIRLGYE